jgi:hypothetical protein
MKVKTKAYIHDHVVDDRDHQHLMPNCIYTVIGIDNENFRVVNEIGEPILYPKELFDIVDSVVPGIWVKKEFEDGDYYIDPPELSEAGFYEDYFDMREDAVKTFQKFLRENKVTGQPIKTK